MEWCGTDGKQSPADGSIDTNMSSPGIAPTGYPDVDPLVSLMRYIYIVSRGRGKQLHAIVGQSYEQL
jgi:hypothetical protein